jgi:predicted nuclease of restriction endonuclease-like (RecB) superfamily
MAKRLHPDALVPSTPPGYGALVSGISQLLDQARRAAARTVNHFLTATYWDIGRRIVEFEQGGQVRARYGEALLKRLAHDLTARHGRGFGLVNLSQMRKFYQLWPTAPILQTPSEKLLAGTAAHAVPPSAIPLPWSHYVRLMALENPHARSFYETEALRGGWSVRKLDRQIGSLFYERTALSKNKAAMLQKGQQPRPEDAVTAEEEIRDPYILEFLALKDEYSETELEEALIRHLETFLLELGDDFAFVSRQRRLRIDDQWFRVDLVFFHRRLCALLIIDLKTGPFTHADAGQMHLYLNYAREHWTRPGENPPVGLILCTEKGHNVVKYALEGLPNKVLASTYRTTLPDEATLTAELDRTRKLLEHRTLPPLPKKGKKR